jgi:hypothetical protein
MQISSVLHVCYIVRSAKSRRFERHRLHAEQMRTAHARATSFRCLGADFSDPAKELACTRSPLVRSSCNVYGLNRLKQAVRTIYSACCANEFWAHTCTFFCGRCVYSHHFPSGVSREGVFARAPHKISLRELLVRTSRENNLARTCIHVYIVHILIKI